jgi:(E)-4-hydroxy-3-methyl-but-2-enyl pyrophosphate reductase
MKVILAKSAGFCWGVERAINIAREYAETAQKTVYTDGPLIHNKQMVEKLEESGVHEIGDYQSSADLSIAPKQRENSVLVIRAHGISPERRQYLKGIGLPFKDATCPDVGIIAGKIRIHARKGFATVIFGDPQHPETIGLMGYTMDKGYVIRNTEDIDNLPDLGDQVCMVSQSTMFTDEFNRLAEHLQKRYPNALIFDTICGATKERQGDVVNLVNQGAQALVVIGGHHSANTVKLASLARKQNLPTFHIETAKEIKPEDFVGFETVGVTAGASTPDFLIQEVVRTLEAIQ